jgi:hypothetical protein
MDLPEQCGGAVHYEHRKPRFRHHACRLYEQLLLVLGIVCTGICHIVQHILGVEPVPGCSEAKSGEEGEGSSQLAWVSYV